MFLRSVAGEPYSTGSVQQVMRNAIKLSGLERRPVRTLRP